MHRQTGLVSRLCLWLPQEVLLCVGLSNANIQCHVNDLQPILYEYRQSLQFDVIKYNKGLKNGMWKFNIIFFLGCMKQQSSQQQLSLRSDSVSTPMLLFTKNINIRTIKSWLRQ